MKPSHASKKDKTKQSADRANTHANLGTIGHVHAGKTTLASAFVKALGKRVLDNMHDTPREQREKEREES